MLNKNINGKNLFLMGTGVGVIFFVFVWITSMFPSKVPTDVLIQSSGGHAQNPTPKETKKMPAVMDKQSVNLPAESIVDKKVKQANPPIDANKEIIYEFPLTERILVQ